MDVDAELERVRVRASMRADVMVARMQRKLYLDGKADRAAMGNPDPTFCDLMRYVANNVRKAFAPAR